MTIGIVIDGADEQGSSVFVFTAFIARTVSARLVEGARARVKLNSLRLNLVRFLIFGALIFAAAACSEVQGQDYQPVPMSASKTLVYIYRPWHFLGSGNSPMVTCGHESVELEAGGYHTFYDDAGPITCNASGAAAPLQFNAEADGAYYVREEYGANGQVQLTLADADLAKGEIKDCRLQSVAPAPSAAQ
jgi:hypothetical protein